MSKYDYEVSRGLSELDPPFYAIIMAAMRKADDTNAALLRSCYPMVWDELWARYNAPGGVLEGDR